MKKKTCILHYGAGVVAALVMFFISIPIGIMLAFLFLTLEVWDAVKGRDSWWDFQEFVLACFAVSVLVLVLSASALIFGTGVCS